MGSTVHNWKRFLNPRGKKLTLSPEGYLPDPDSEYGSLFNPELVTTESVLAVRCMVLLGEPGIGKTHVLRSWYQDIEAGAADKPSQTLYLDLREYGVEDRLIKNLFESASFLRWLDGNVSLHIFLDGLDECLLRIDNVATLLANEFQRRLSTRIELPFLRIACRTAIWSEILEKGLLETYQKEGVEIYEIAPLRQDDVREAATALGLDADSFLEELGKAEAGALANRPITLAFLLNLYRRNKNIPLGKTQLYSEGCGVLCEEMSESRRAARKLGTLSAEQRMSIASRIAAITILCNKDAVNIGPRLGDALKEDVVVQELYGREESPGIQLEVNHDTITEVLDTGLFSSRGAERMGWAHQSYAEFLAARYLIQHKMPSTQIMSLLVHPGDPNGKLVPQLIETAAWLASMEPEVLLRIMKTDPVVLLRADITGTDEKNRAEIAKGLLKQIEEGKLRFGELLGNRLAKLAHQNLSKQIRPYICDNHRQNLVRVVAMEIAQSCFLQTLQSDLLTIVMNSKEPIDVRVQAANTLKEIGDDRTKEKMRPLVLVGENAPNDELKYCALRVLWPNHITATELFQILTSLDESLSGAYSMLLAGDVLQLRTNDIPVALEWVEREAPSTEGPSSSEHLMDQIMFKAWDNIDSAEVLNGFARAALSRLRRTREIAGDIPGKSFRDLLKDDDNRRRQVLKAIILLISDPKDSSFLAFSRTPVVSTRDTPWMIDQLQKSECELHQEIWAKLIRFAFDLRDATQVNDILTASETNSILEKELSSFIQPVSLESEDARKMKEAYLALQMQPEDHPLLEPPPEKRISALLDKIAFGDSSAWWRLNMEMTLEPSDTHYGDELESDLTTLPGWRNANDATKSRIVEAAKKFLSEQDPRPHLWIGTNKIHRPAFAGYRALRLILHQDPEFFQAISSEIWRKWSSIIVAYPTLNDSQGNTIHRRIVKTAYDNAPNEIIQYIAEIIDMENQQQGSIQVISKMEDCWDDRVAEMLLTKLEGHTLSPSHIGDLLDHLLDHNNEKARLLAESLLRLPIPTSGDERSAVIAAGEALLIHLPSVGWRFLWPAIQQDSQFGRDVISSVAGSDSGEDAIFQGLTEGELADLYVWIMKNYPDLEEEPTSRAKFVEAHALDARIWGARVLSHLKQRGNKRSCEALRKIVSIFPDWIGVRDILLEAEALLRYYTWAPPRPQDVLKMADSREKRLIQSGEQLLDLLEESLVRLGQWLQGETPRVSDLWNTPKDAWRPKEEAHLSDYVVSHLRRDIGGRAIVVNREVEIRRIPGSGMGEKTDIMVEAITRGQEEDASDRITAIIEVKGSWNEELTSAMKTQLVDQYLKTSGVQHGLYLAGWFSCDKWDDTDSRKGKSLSHNLDETTKKLNAQAEELSKHGVSVRAFILDTAIHTDQ